MKPADVCIAVAVVVVPAFVASRIEPGDHSCARTRALIAPLLPEIA